MHGFIGCVEQDARSAQAMADWMAEWIKLEPRKGAFQAGSAPFLYMGSTESDAGGSPTASGPDGLTLVYSGFVARDQLCDATGAEPQTDSEVAAALLTLYQSDGAEALAALNGRYVVAVHDAQVGELHLMNDAIGLKPVFVWQDGSSFAFASNVWAIVCHPRFRKEIDLRGMVDLLMLSHQQATRTLHKDVSVLAPGSVTTFSGSKLTSRTVRNLEFSDARWSWGMDRIADEMYQHLTQSLRRRIPDGVDVRLPLSGGVDSRTILGLLAERPVRIHAFTQCQPGAYNVDARNAKQMARRVRIPLKRVPLADDFLARYRQKCVAINGGLYDIHTGRYLSMSDQSRTDAYAVVSGHLGGELTGRFQIPDTAFASRDERYALAFKEVNMFRFDAARMRALLAEALPEGLVEESLAECKGFYMSHTGEAFQQGMNWDIMLSRRRYISFQVLYLEQFCRAAAPFYDREFVDLMCSVPFCALEGQRAYLDMVCRHFPGLARVPNSNTDRPLIVSTRFVVTDFARTQYRHLVQRPLHRVLKLRRWVGNPCLQHGFALMGPSSSVLDHIVGNAEQIAPYLDPVTVRKEIDDHLRGANVHPMGLLALSAFVTTLEMLDDPYLAIRAWQNDGGPGS